MGVCHQFCTIHATRALRQVERSCRLLHERVESSMTCEATSVRSEQILFKSMLDLFHRSSACYHRSHFFRSPLVYTLLFPSITLCSIKTEKLNRPLLPKYEKVPIIRFRHKTLGLSLEKKMIFFRSHSLF